MLTVEWQDGCIRIIDQTQLPHRLRLINLRSVEEVVKAIKALKVRGAPAIGVAAAFGCVLGAGKLEATAKKLIASRPTAVNIRWAVDRMIKMARAGKGLPINKLKQLLLAEALKIQAEDIEADKKIGFRGASLVKDGMSILTLCNTGALAAVDYGTALGVIRTAHNLGKKIHVYVAETRPRLQGAKLTAWELKRLKIPFTLITDNMIGYFMRQAMVHMVMVGADRIASNGDFANKIGTYTAAVLAKAHAIPFYVAAPLSSIDFSIPSGDQIVIEERDPREVTNIGRERITPAGVRAANPAFDITDAKYITAVITEMGIIKPGEIKKLWR